MTVIDLNSDVGESFGNWTLGDDAAMLAIVTSANVATGFHAGDPLIMRTTCEKAASEGVTVGAHVAYRDLHGFGRFEAEDQLRAFLLGSQARGLRAVLVITGQGRRGGGVIRASFEEWLHAAALRGVVSGFSSAGRRHGGEGAFYVTLKRRT